MNIDQNHPSSDLNLPHWRYIPRLKGLSGVYLNTAIRQLSLNLMGIFIPIYMFKITGRVELIFLNYFLMEIFVLLSTMPVAKLVKKYGPDISMLISNLTRSMFLVLLTLSKQFPVLLWPAAIFAGLTIPLYWLPYHSAFSFQSKKGKLSKQIAKLSNISRLVTLLAPLFGGVIAELMGFETLFPLGIVLLVVSSLPIFLDEYNRKEIAPKFDVIRKEIFSKKEKHLFLSLFFEGFRLPINAVCWPLILYTVMPNLEKIGGLATLTSLVCLVLITFLAKKIKKFKIRPFAFGNLGRSFVWAMRAIFIANPLVIILSDPIFNIFSVFFDLPYSLLIYDHGKKQSLPFFIKREFALHGGYMVANLIFFLLFANGGNWQKIIEISIISSLLMTIFTIEYSRQKKTIWPFRAKIGRI